MCQQKRQDIFREELTEPLQRLSETCWVERHDRHLQFQGDSLVKICNALQKIAEWKDSNSVSKAGCLYQALRSSFFIVAATCLCDILGN